MHVPHQVCEEEKRGAYGQHRPYGKAVKPVRKINGVGRRHDDEYTERDIEYPEIGGGML